MPKKHPSPRPDVVLRKCSIYKAKRIVTKLLQDIILDIGCLHNLTELVSTLDMVTGFAQVCTFSNYTRPEFTDTLAIKVGRHAILERISPEPPVPNNTYLTIGSNFAIITGPNMSGKSTYLKQVALMQIMAQIGCFVPAEYASFRLINHLFSRKGSGDDIETNSSTFIMEMKEINYILRMATDASLIIIDELGRGTSVEEGVGLCYSICEELLRMKAFTLFTTHFMELTYLDCVYPNVCNYHLDVNRVTSECGNTVRLLFSYTIREGPTTELGYGIRLAELSSLPKSVLEDAAMIATEAREQFQVNNPHKKEDSRRRAVFHLATRLFQVARNSKVGTDALLPYLNSLKLQYHQQISELLIEE